MITVTAAASVFFFKPEFDDFLYSPISSDDGEMPLSVLSALSRMNIDPWEEAAELSELPPGTATLRLAVLIERLPGGRWAAAESQAVAARLITLLPRRSSFKTQPTEKSRVLYAMNGSTFAMILLCVALAIAALIFVAGR